MPAGMATNWGDTGVVQPTDPRSARILAKTVYRDLRMSGLRHEDLIAFAAEMIGLVATGVRDGQAADGTPQR